MEIVVLQCIPSGLPQGSHLGPLLFILFFNDATKIFKFAKLGVFADDLKLYAKINSSTDAVYLQEDMDLFSAWCKKNGMELSIDKCKIMTFHRKSLPIDHDYRIESTSVERVREIRDLGVTLDEKLNFNSHVAKIVSKAHSMLGFLKRICYEFRNVRALTSIYNAHVRSHLEYASVLWNPHYAVRSGEIESVQKQFVMFALRKSVRRDSNFRLPPYADRCSSLGLETLARRRDNSCIFFVFDVLRKNIDAPQLLEIFDSLRTVNRTYSFRTMNIFRTVFHRTKYRASEPINAASKLFNTVSHLYVDETSRESFRAKVRALTTIREFTPVSHFHWDDCVLCHEFVLPYDVLHSLIARHLLL